MNVAGGMNRKGLMQDDFILRVMSPIFIAMEFLLQKPKVATFLFDRWVRGSEQLGRDGRE